MKISSKAGPRRIPAFTLIELLVVIAIIALLAAILFPVFGQVREKARSATCQSNEKQIGVGITQYMQDYDESFPVGNAWSATDPGWGADIQPYVKSTQIFLCPSVPPGPVPLVGTLSAIADLPGSSCYDINYNTTITNNAPVLESVLTSPSNTVLVTEDAGDAFLYSYTSKATTGEVDHQNGSNYEFADGHVKWLISPKINATSVLSGSSNCGTAAGPGTNSPNGSNATFCID